MSVKTGNEIGAGAACVRGGEAELQARLAAMEAELAESRQAVLRQEGVMAALISCIPMGVHVYRLGDDGRLFLVSSNDMADRIFGVVSASLLSQPIEAVFPWLMATEIPSRCREVAETGKAWRSDQVSVACATVSCCVEVHAVQMERGVVIAMFRDVSHQNALAQRLRQAEKMETIGRMTGGVVHDINNQLTVIRGYAEVVERLVADAAVKEFMSFIRTAADHSAQLARQLLAIARRDSAQHKETDVHDILRQVTGVLELATPVKLRIGRRMRAVPSITMGDASLLQNAFLNLCLNARDAMPLGGDLTLTTDVVVHDASGEAADSPKLATGIYLVVEVRDTGTGMDDDTKKRLFEPFFTTKGSEGTGLGLAGVLRTVKSHGGAVTVESALGRGSAFRVFLPISRTGGGYADAEVGGPQGRSRVLLIGAERAARTFLGHVLADAGYDLACCDGLAEVEAFYRSNRQGVVAVIMDAASAGGRVAEVLALLSRQAAGIRMMILTAPGHQDAGLEPMLKSGAVQHLSKPVHRSELLRLVEEGRQSRSSD